MHPKPTRSRRPSRQYPKRQTSFIARGCEFFNNSGNPDSTAETLEEAVTLAPVTVIVSALGVSILN